MSDFEGFSNVIKSGNGNTLILTALIAAAIANALPTPGDVLYFSKQQSLKEDLEKGKITPKEYWTRNIGYHYLFSSLWYVALILLVLSIGAKYETNTKILLVVLSGGLVLGVLKRNIEKDEEILKLKQQYAGRTTESK